MTLASSSSEENVLECLDSPEVELSDVTSVLSFRDVADTGGGVAAVDTLDGAASSVPMVAPTRCPGHFP